MMISGTSTTDAGIAFMITRRRVHRLAAGHVDPDALERAHARAEHAAALLAHLPARRDALAVEVAHAHRGLAERGAVGRVDLLAGLLELGAAHLELAQVRAVELPGERADLLVADLAHAIDDPAHRLGDVVLHLFAAAHELGERAVEPVVLRLEHGEDRFG